MSQPSSAASWPDGAAVAVIPLLSVQWFEPGHGPAIQAHLADHEPDIANAGWRAYGNAWGLPRLLRAFGGTRFSVALNASVLKHEPQVWPMLADRCAVVAHGTTNSHPLPVEDGPAAEEAYVRKCLDLLEAATTVRPLAWLSPSFVVSAETPGVLTRCGIRASFDATDSDVIATTGPLTVIPYSLSASDISLVLGQKLDARAFAQMLLDHVAQLARDAAAQERRLVTTFGLHTFIVGQPAYALHLAEVIDALRADPRVWLTDHEALLEARD